MLERRTLLEGLQKKQQQDEIDSIALFQKKKATTKVSIKNSKQKVAKQSSLLRKLERRKRRQQKLVPVSSSSDSTVKAAVPTAERGMAFSLVKDEGQSEESENRRWVRVDKGKWQLLTPQGAAAVKTSGLSQKTSKNAIVTAVVPFSMDEAQSRVAPANIIRSDGLWNDFMCSHSPTKTLRKDATIATVELTIEDLP